MRDKSDLIYFTPKTHPWLIKSLNTTPCFLLCTQIIQQKGVMPEMHLFQLIWMGSFVLLKSYSYVISVSDAVKKTKNKLVFGPCFQDNLMIIISACCLLCLMLNCLKINWHKLMSVVRSMLHSELDVKQTTSFHIKKLTALAAQFSLYFGPWFP